MPLQDITITASINSIATQSYGQKTYVASTDEQSFPIEEITGSSGAVWPNFTPNTNYTVDLVVNVTQSWSGSNVTPLGYVPYTHDTIEEFINGEFSGSEYTVTDGNLNDAQCEQFLTVSTIPTNYSMFPYATTYIDYVLVVGTSSLDFFLDKRTIPSNGQFLMHYNVNTITDVFPNYTLTDIDYIKIARIDQEGADNTLSLQELTSIRWTDFTASLIDLTVLNITEYPNYYLYKVSSKTWVDLIYYADDNVLNYAFSASSAGSMTATANLFYLNNWNVINNATGQFGGTYYNFALTPNCNIIYTASIDITNPNGSSVDFNFGFWSTSDFNTFIPIQTSSLQTLGPGASTTVTLTDISYNQFYGQTSYWLETRDNSLPLTITNASWVMTQSQSPQLSTSSVIIEPYLVSTFTNSDCDVLINNYSQNDTSQYVRRVLYEDGGTVPSNLRQIINGTAEFAEVNDYLYTSNANTLPRYQGVRTTSQDFNLPSTNGFSNTQLSELDPVTLSDVKGTSNVRNTTTYLAYFSELRSNNPILKGTTSPVIKYLIREDGTFYSPSTDEVTYYNTVDSFPKDSQAYTNLLYETTTTFNSTQSIILSGESFIPVMHNIEAANNEVAIFTGSMSFTNFQGNPNNPVAPTTYSLWVMTPGGGFTSYLPGSPIITNIEQNIFNSGSSGLYYGTLDDPLNNWNFPPGNYPLLSPSISSSGYNFSGLPNVTVRFRMNGWNSLIAGGRGGNNYTSIGWSTPPITPGTYTIRFALKVYNSITNITTELDNRSTNINVSQYYSGVSEVDDMSFNGYSNNAPNSSNINYNGYKVWIYDFQPSAGDKLFLTARLISGPNLTTPFYLRHFSIELLTLGVSVPSLSGGTFWYAGNNTVLTSSSQLAGILSSNYIQQVPENSGFQPFQVPCTPAIGDEFRIGYDEENTFTIVQWWGAGGLYYYQLDRPIPSTIITDINNFLVRRKIKDYITGITLKSPLYFPIQDGFLLPEYPSDEIKKNLPNIVKKLTSEAII